MSETEPKWLRYVVLLTQTGQPMTRELLGAHVAHLRRLDRDGQLVLCGPFQGFPGGMLVLRASSLEEARRLAEADPFVASGFERCEVRTWELSCEENNHLGAG